mmetsp:Transcript_19783/g.37230  ORF Transcript_19783/g.37230 Transcript_19783/m.37230 type:complete len:493 (+) Transcript_19783:82-1560(+)
MTWLARILFSTVWLAQAYRDSDSVGVSTLHRDPVEEEKDGKTEGPKDAVLPDREPRGGDDTPSDCHYKRTALKNWILEFEPLQEKIRNFVREENQNADPEAPFGGLVSFADENIQLQLGVKVTFKKDGECTLKAEDIKFSTSPNCEEDGVKLNTTEEDALDGHKQFFLTTGKPVVVLTREPVGDDADASLIGDWTFPSGDFTVKKDKDGKLQLIEKFWKNPVPFTGTMEAADPKNFHHVQLAVSDAECAKFKDCSKAGDSCTPTNTDDKSRCQAKEGMNHGHLRLKSVKPNEMIRHSSNDNQTWTEFLAHRSFTPNDVKTSGFVCVQTTNGSWMAVGGTTFRQIPGWGQWKPLAKKTNESHGMFMFANESFGHSWLQENHRTFVSASDDEFLPPWRNYVQGTVEWKKAAVCPENYPLCLDDGDCALQECGGGCEWSRAPSSTSDPSGGYNYVSGVDSFGTACDIDAEVMHARSSAASVTLGMTMLLAVSHFF